VLYPRRIGATTSRDRSALRSAEQAALASDVSTRWIRSVSRTAFSADPTLGRAPLVPPRRSGYSAAAVWYRPAGPQKRPTQSAGRTTLLVPQQRWRARPDTKVKIHRHGRHDAARAVAHCSRNLSRLPGLSDH
jgi:hypothetical protein